MPPLMVTVPVPPWPLNTRFLLASLMKVVPLPPMTVSVPRPPVAMMRSLPDAKISALEKVPAAPVLMTLLPAPAETVALPL